MTKDAFREVNQGTEVIVSWCKTSNLHIEHLVPWLRPLDFESAERLRSKSARLQHLAGRALLHHTLQNNLAVPSDYYELRRLRSGRVVTERLKAASLTAWNVSISHTRGCVSAAVSQIGRVGVDVENTVVRRNWQGIVDAFFHEADVEHLNLLELENAKLDFLQTHSVPL